MARVLVIDDDAGVRTPLWELLKSAGQAVLATSGSEGLNLYRTAPTDLVITDFFMPHQEGLETIIQFRKEFPGVAINAMSGKPARVTLLDIAQRLGAVALLEKPFSSAQFLRAVAEAL